MPVAEILQYVDKGGTIAVLVLILIAGYKGGWVFGRQYRDCKDELVEWKRLALQATHVAEKLAPGDDHAGS